MNELTRLVKDYWHFLLKNVRGWKQWVKIHLNCGFVGGDSQLNSFSFWWDLTIWEDQAVGCHPTVGLAPSQKTSWCFRGSYLEGQPDRVALLQWVQFQHLPKAAARSLVLQLTAHTDTVTVEFNLRKEQRGEEAVRSEWDQVKPTLTLLMFQKSFKQSQRWDRFSAVGFP